MYHFWYSQHHFSALFFFFLIYPSFACSMSKHFFKKALSRCVLIKQRQLRDPDFHNNHKYSYANNRLHVSVTKLKRRLQSNKYQPGCWCTSYLEKEIVIQDISAKCFLHTHTLHIQNYFLNLIIIVSINPQVFFPVNKLTLPHLLPTHRFTQSYAWFPSYNAM